ncbi:MAG: ankyrin repeat domain-containing protein, partial [Chlamydiota bacterium]
MRIGPSTSSCLTGPVIDQRVEQENKIYRKLEPLVREVWQQLTPLLQNPSNAKNLPETLIAREKLDKSLATLAEKIHQLVKNSKKIFNRGDTLPYQLESSHYFIPRLMEPRLRTTLAGLHGCEDKVLQEMLTPQTLSTTIPTTAPPSDYEEVLEDISTEIRELRAFVEYFNTPTLDFHNKQKEALAIIERAKKTIWHHTTDTKRPTTFKSMEAICRGRQIFILFTHCHDAVVIKSAFNALIDILSADPLQSPTAFGLIDDEKKLRKIIHPQHTNSDDTYNDEDRGWQPIRARSLPVELQQLLMKAYGLALINLLLHIETGNLNPNLPDQTTKEEIWQVAIDCANQETTDPETCFWNRVILRAANDLKNGRQGLCEMIAPLQELASSSFLAFNTIAEGASGGLNIMGGNYLGTAGNAARAAGDATATGMSIAHSLYNVFKSIPKHPPWFQALIAFSKSSRFALHDQDAFNSLKKLVQDYIKEDIEEPSDKKQPRTIPEEINAFIATKFFEAQKASPKDIGREARKRIPEIFDKTDSNLYYGIIATLEFIVLHTSLPQAKKDTIKLLMQFMGISTPKIQRRTLQALKTIADNDPNLQLPTLIIIELHRITNQIMPELCSYAKELVQDLPDYSRDNIKKRFSAQSVCEGKSFDRTTILKPCFRSPDSFKSPQLNRVISAQDISLEVSSTSLSDKRSRRAFHKPYVSFTLPSIEEENSRDVTSPLRGALPPARYSPEKAAISITEDEQSTEQSPLSLKCKEPSLAFLPYSDLLKDALKHVTQVKTQQTQGDYVISILAHSNEKNTALILDAIIQYLHPEVVEDIFSLNPYYYAVREQSYSLISALHERGIGNVNILHPSSKETALHFAIRELHDSKMVKLLLSIGADPYAANGNGKTPFHLAATITPTTCLKILLEATRSEICSTVKAPLLTYDLEGNAPLNDAIAADNWQAVKLLQEYGAKITSDHESITPLIQATRLSTYEVQSDGTRKITLKAENVLKEFISNHQGPFSRLEKFFILSMFTSDYIFLPPQKRQAPHAMPAKCSDDFAKFHFKMKKKAPQYAELFESSAWPQPVIDDDGSIKIDIPQVNGTLPFGNHKLIVLALQSDKLAEVKSILENERLSPEELDALINIGNDIGATPLHAATLAQNEDLVEYLLKMGAKPDTATIDGFTPLHIAAFWRNERLIQLLSNKSSRYTSNIYGEIPAHIFCGNYIEHSSLLTYTLVNPATGFDLLSIERKDSPQALTILLPPLSKITSRDSRGDSLLMRCVKESFIKESTLELIDLILSEYPKLFWYPDSQGLIPLQITALKQRPQTLERLVRAKYPNNIQGLHSDILSRLKEDRHLSLGNLLAFSNQYSLLKDLFQQNPELAFLSSETPSARTPLHVAARNGHDK